MTAQPVPRHVRKVIELLEAHPTRAWTIGELVSECQVGCRTLQRQFRRFLGLAPMEFLRDLRLDHARRQILRASDRETVTDIAMRCGFNHLGRFATRYRERHGESPSTTLARRRNTFSIDTPRPPLLAGVVRRPAIAVAAFDSIGRHAGSAGKIAEEMGSALRRWIAVTKPESARYHLRGKVQGAEGGRLQITAMLVDQLTGQYLWADHWQGDSRSLPSLVERVAARVALAIQPSIREAEVYQASRKDPTELNVWELTMRALPCVLSVEPTLHGSARHNLPPFRKGCDSFALRTAARS